MAQMSDDELAQLVSSEISNSVSYNDSDISSDRRDVFDYYMGEAFGDEREGYSQFVSRDVLDVIESMMPPLMRVFASSERVVEFDPTGPEDVAQAKQATDYVNFVFNHDNDGFMVLYQFIKDGLMYKRGVTKTYWQTEETWSAPETYTGLDEDQYVLLTEGDDVQVTEHSQEAEITIDPMSGLEIELPTHSVTLRRKNVRGICVVDNIPPEEFMICSDARASDRNIRFKAHRRPETRSNLILAGYDREMVESIPLANDDHNDEASNRMAGQEDADTTTLDDSEQEVWVTDAYIRCDVDEDGISELVHVVMGGDDANGVILHREEVEDDPFSDWCPVPIPHRYYGLSVGDLVMDIQRIKSTLYRQTLDNLYLSNNPRKQAVLNQIDDVSSLLDTVPGGIIPVKQIGAIQNEVTPFVAQHSYGMISELDEVIDKRTGISGANGIDPDLLQNATAAATAQVMSLQQQRIEMITRLAAEGVACIFSKMLKVIRANQDKERVIRLRNEWVTVDPSAWASEFDVSVNVGMGRGSQQTQMMQLQAIIDKQETLMSVMGPNGPIVNMTQYANALHKWVEQVGFKDASAFFSMPDPQQMQQQGQQQPSPEVMKAQAEIQQKQQESQAQQQLKQFEANAKIEIDRERVMGELAIKREEMNRRMELEAQEAAANARRKDQELQMEAGLEAAKMAMTDSPDAQGNIPSPE
ncbi:MAG TPA: hypothetical protein DD397_06785 [Hyphomonas sp.]|jgi:hypothetical protein|uniref:portal protein n=1 Tax=Hyphomonas sp. TaxID=87 RepID=UPI000E8A201D|nr:hypothetical protein [Hyphomonas sp.]QDP49079.1 MAG: putative portal protein [Prokaryotic dsDNA virus sp.]HBN92251.1 hypothetical protein [Hyphomonas sp.]|tara:strand:+ start:11506 stop:13599 length:2094 start_codon:yes stop_codon:yes gene_type:complete